MITVAELARKLAAYCSAAPDNGKHEVFLLFDDDIAFEFSHADTASAMDGSSMEMRNLLVMIPDQRGKRLRMKAIMKEGNA